MIKAIGYAAQSAHGKLKPFEFERNDPKANEVQVEILFSGICHSDLHQVKNDWKNTVYPCLPGHEIVGKVVKIGAEVKKFKVGDIAGIGCMVDSCHECKSCKEGLENYCEEGFLATYNGNARTPTKENLTFGGYSNTIVVREDFVLRVPHSLDPAAVAPILCAGVTTFSPLRHWKVKKGTKVGVVGFGGLGNMAIKLAVAMGAEVTLITTSAEKKEHALKIGAKKVIVSTDKDEMSSNERSLDLILSTIPDAYDANPYVGLLNRDGTFCNVGCLTPLKTPLDMSSMNMDRRSFGSTLIGSIAETQDVLDFCAQYKVTPDIKVIAIDEVNTVFDQLLHKKADFRYVIDMASIKGKHEDKTLLEKIGL